MDVTTEAAADPLASTLPPPPPALSDLEVDAILDVTLGAELVEMIPSKRCSCGTEHDLASWSKLAYVGVMCDGVERIELRNCRACNSTIAVLLCIVEGCSRRPAWKALDATLRDYCDEHATEWLMSERGCPPHDFADGDVCSKCDSLRGR